uniref:Ionotropic glutamate receptor C-terminal domain-containing protein n=1 Tax=Strigamia maritima TaxID=126957 RepID=T1JL44_STRMM
MMVVRYAAVVFCISAVICVKDTGFTNQRKKNLVEKFSASILKSLKWTQIVVLTDNQDFVYLAKHLSQHLITARVAHVNKFNLNELNNFGSVLIISKSNTAIRIVKKGLKLNNCPSNWLLILDKKFENFGIFFIPHDIALYLLDFEHFHELWFILRLYSDNGNVIKAQKNGFWNPKNGDLLCSRLPVALPSYIEMPVRLTTIAFKPFFSHQQTQGKNTIEGLHGEILKTIQGVISFNVSISIPEDKLFGNIINKSYVTGMESDMGISLTKIKDRLAFISYSPDITRVRAKLLYHHKLGAQERFFFYLEPFSRVSWICIMAFTILFAVLLTFVSFIKNKVLRRPKMAIRNVQIIYYYLRSALQILLQTGKSIPVQVYGISGRICLLVFHIFCIVMFINYCSSLTSILAVTRLKLPFKSFYDFLYNSKYDLATLKDSSIVQVFKDSKLDLYIRGYKKFSSNPEKLLVKSNKDGKDLVYNQKIAYLMEEVTLLIVVGNNCSFRFMDEVIMEADFSFTYNKQFAYKQLFNRYIQLLLQNGVNYKLYNDRNPEDHNAYCDRLKREISAIEIPDVLGLFFTLFLGVIIALIVFVLEILYRILF